MKRLAFWGVIGFLSFSAASPAQADIFQWEYINPADPSQGKRLSTTLAPEGADVDAMPDADLSARNLTMAYLIGADLTNAHAFGANLTNADLSQAKLSNAILQGATLTDTKFTGAEVSGADFGRGFGQNFGSAFDGPILFGTGITLDQLYSTASYQARQLTGISLSANNLAGGNFAGQNLTNSWFGKFWYDSLRLRWVVYYATLTDVDFTGADVRGASGFYPPASATTKNLILPDGHIDGLDLSDGRLLVVRDYDGRPEYGPTTFPPIQIAVDRHLAMGPGGTLRMVFEADAWDSTISFAPGIPITLGGTLELTFADNVNHASQIGRTFDLFNWTGVNPPGAFTVFSAYGWDLSNLYSSGEVTLTAVPEPSALILLTLAVAVVTTNRRRLQLGIAVLPLVAFAASARADINQWEYINPADPSEGKRQSTTLAPDGVGVDAMPGAHLSGRDLTMAYLIGADLMNANAYGTNLTNADFSYANLTDSSFYWGTLSDADFTGVDVRGANFNKLLFWFPPVITIGTGISLPQLYSTASYQAGDLRGISFGYNELAGGNFAGQNLTNAHFSGATLTDVDFTGADVRGASGVYPPASATTNNLILPDGHIDGLNLSDGSLLVVRDYDGGSVYNSNTLPIPITVDQHLSMGVGGMLRMVFEADAWDSTISFAPEIPATLGGTLDLTFADDVDLASQIGRTFDLFDWTDVNPTGAFSVDSPYTWNLSNLYTTGEVTLTGVPEPSTLVLLTLALTALAAKRRNLFCKLKCVIQVVTAIPVLIIACPARADIYQWEYINPADPSQGKQESATLAPEGAGVNAAPGANLSGRDLTKAYLVNAGLSYTQFAGLGGSIFGSFANFTNTNLGQADLTNADLSTATLTNTNFTDAAVKGAQFNKVFGVYFGGYGLRGTGITLAQLYSTASYQARDLGSIGLQSNNLAGGNFAGHQLTFANFSGAIVTGGDFRQAHLTYASFDFAELTDAEFTGAMVQGANFRYSGITTAQLYSTASYQARDLSGMNLSENNLAGGNFSGQNLNHSTFADVALSGADLTGAQISGANLRNTSITLGQLYSTTSYQLRDLSGIALGYNSLSGGDFARQNLSNADFYSTNLASASFHEANLKGANFFAAFLDSTDFRGADVRGANFEKGRFADRPMGGGIALAQLYSTQSYQSGDLSGIKLIGNTLAGGNFADQNLTNANFSDATLTDADFTGAVVSGTNFEGHPFYDPKQSGVTLEQLYSTTSYRRQDLVGINLSGNDLEGADFTGQNLTDADFSGAANLANADFRRANLSNVYFNADLTGANFSGQNLTNVSFDRSTLTGADLTAADARGVYLSSANSISTNLILPDSHINGLNLDSGRQLIVRDYDGRPEYGPEYGPIPITVDQHLAIGPGGKLQMVFEADAWDSTVSFAAGIPVTLGGTLELTFAADVDLASQIGRTFDLFDWTGVNPTGAFSVDSPYAWNLSNLYTTGEVTLTGVPEPSTLVLLSLALTALAAKRRNLFCKLKCVMKVVAAIPMLIIACPARADIYQWEYIDPADPNQGKQQSKMLAPNGAGVDASPGADLSARNLTTAYLIGADLTNADGFLANLTNADLSQANLTKALFRYATLTGASLTRSNFREADLTGATFHGATLTDADLTGTDVGGAIFDIAFNDSGIGFVLATGSGITLTQLYSTASYQSHALSGIGLAGSNLAGGNFAGQNLTNANFYAATLTDADFTTAKVGNANFAHAGPASLFATGISLSQLYSTASYQAKDLSGVILGSNNLSGGNFAGQNLTNASFGGAILKDADFTDAQIRGAHFAPPLYLPSAQGFNADQLYSTASYKAHDLSGTGFIRSYLVGWNFSGQNLSNASFSDSILVGVNFTEANLTNAYFYTASLSGVDFTAADARGAILLAGSNLAFTTTTNLIEYSGHIHGLDLATESLLVVRDYDGGSVYNPNTLPIPITVDEHLVMGSGGTLRMVFEADAWDSTVSFAPGIPITLGGTLELTFVADVNLASQVGRTLDLFDWTGVNPTGAFSVVSPYAWNLSNLYTTGEVTLTAVPEPCTLVLFSFVLTPLVAMDRVRRFL